MPNGFGSLHFSDPMMMGRFQQFLPQGVGFNVDRPGMKDPLTIPLGPEAFTLPGGGYGGLADIIGMPGFDVGGFLGSYQGEV